MIAIGYLGIPRWLEILGWQLQAGSSGLLVEERASSEPENVADDSEHVGNMGNLKLGGLSDELGTGNGHGSPVISDGCLDGKEEAVVTKDKINLGDVFDRIDEDVAVSGDNEVRDLGIASDVGECMEGMVEKLEQMWPNMENGMKFRFVSYLLLKIGLSENILTPICEFCPKM